MTKLRNEREKGDRFIIYFAKWKFLLSFVHAENSTQVVMGYPHHIIQRGHNRQVVFASDEDYQYYLDNLCEWKEKLGCKVYAYCLMTNHVHLIVDPR